MSNSNCDEQLDLSGLITKMSESLTDIQWYVLEGLFVDGDTLEAVGGKLGTARARVSYIQSQALDELIKVFDKEIECFSIRLEKLLSEAGGTLTVEECFTTFPEINEPEFNILFEVCQKNREGVFHREKGMVSIGEKT